MTTIDGRRSDRLIWTLLGLLVLLGAWLRFANLGELGFRWDEDLSSLAVQAILEKGVPELPSGMVYLRGGLFLYAMAASAEVLGFSELALRVPAAIFGIATIPLAFFFGRALFGSRVGLVLAALLTVSFWDVEFSRYARMYAPFGFFYLLTLLCLWKYRVESERIVGGIACVLLGIVTVSLHQLGYTLVLAFFYPLIVRGLVLDGPKEWLRPRHWAFPLLGGGAVAAFFFWWRGFVDGWRAQPIEALQQQGPAPGVSEAADSGLPVMLPDLPVLAGAWERAPLLVLLIVAVVLAAGTLYAVRARVGWPDRLLLAAIAVCCAVQMFNLALLGIIVLVFVKRIGLPALRRPDVLFAIGLAGAAFLAWLAVGVTFSLGVDLAGETGLKGTVRSLLNYPHFFIFWGYPNEWPLASAVAAVGLAWAFGRVSRAQAEAAAGLPAAMSAPRGADALPSADPRSAAAAAFALLAWGVPIVVNGLFESPYQLFRYNVPFNPYFFTFIALALFHWRDAAAAWGNGLARLRPREGGAAAGTALLALLVLSFDLNPLRALLVTQRGYLNEGALYRAFDMTRYDDFKTPAAFVTEHAADDDLIVVLDSREFYNYIGRIDYWVRTGVYEGQTYRRGGTLRDQYVDTPLIMSLAELKRVLSAPERRKWLIASESMVAQSAAVTDDIKAFLQSIDEQHVAYVARDGDMKVYRFD